MASTWATSWGTSWATSWDRSAAAAVSQPSGPHGPGWALFGQDHHPVTRKRKKRVEDVEADLVRAFEDATGITAERAQQEAIRELKRAAATALSVAKAEDDPELRARAEQIVALKKLRLQADAYLERVGAILAQLEEQENDDMQAFMLMARLA